MAPGYKLRVLLAQALFADPDILLLDEPTNHLDINTIRWLEGVLNARSSTMVIISHDRHFLNSVCTHMADLDYGTIRVYPGGYDDYMIASTQARERLLAQNAKAKDRIAELRGIRPPFSRQQVQGAPGDLARPGIEKIKVEDIKPSSRQNPYIRFDLDGKARLHRQAVEMERRRQVASTSRCSRTEHAARGGPAPGDHRAQWRAARLHCCARWRASSRPTTAPSNGRKKPRSAITRRTRPTNSTPT